MTATTRSFAAKLTPKTIDREVFLTMNCASLHPIGHTPVTSEILTIDLRAGLLALFSARVHEEAGAFLVHDRPPRSRRFRHGWPSTRSALRATPRSKRFARTAVAPRPDLDLGSWR